MFDQVESVQIYHLLADSTIYEQGTVNKELMFYETAIGFWSTNSNEKAVLSYEPNNMRLSLLPEIAISSNEGYQVAWENEANVYYDVDIDSSVWDSITYMGTMGGSTFTYLLDYALQFSELFNNYQPFSVYEQYPGNRFIAATSCDEFVWFLFEQLASLQISLNPVVVPKKVKIILYSECAPEIYSMNSTQHKTEVASYFQQMKRCLHIRSLQHITTLSEFTGFYSGCLVEYAYLYKDPYSLYKVNLTIPYADNVNPTEDVPQPIGYEGGFTWVDICIAILITGAFFAGVALALRKSLVLEKYGYQKDMVNHQRLKENVA
eukprot:CAMPEP_0117765652 /NCGR_PEP_ID=MMETSP0947-20121206/20277_1 /TAXON_ID=44440 /ORGANISM="Chattonella subsalsa, Strain CCMP2191" /LENGTH=319 /DNA_ID=CAMNT_0005588423 /DNA_START=281 /DNA_END=1240 /DNA_ORIENTATION=+